MLFLFWPVRLDQFSENGNSKLSGSIFVKTPLMTGTSGAGGGAGSSGYGFAGGVSSGGEVGVGLISGAGLGSGRGVSPGCGDFLGSRGGV